MQFKNISKKNIRLLQNNSNFRFLLKKKLNTLLCASVKALRNANLILNQENLTRRKD